MKFLSSLTKKKRKNIIILGIKLNVEVKTTNFNTFLNPTKDLLWNCKCIFGFCATSLSDLLSFFVVTLSIIKRRITNKFEGVNKYISIRVILTM